MERTKLALYITRALQIIFAAIVLGVSVKLRVDWEEVIYWCKDEKLNYCDVYGPINTVITYAAFAAAFGFLDAFVGSLGAVFSSIPMMASMGFDGVAAIFYIASGINSAIRRTHWSKKLDKTGLDLFTRFDTANAFMYLAFLATLAAMILTFMSRRKNKS